MTSVVVVGNTAWSLMARRSASDALLAQFWMKSITAPENIDDVEKSASSFVQVSSGKVPYSSSSSVPSLAVSIIAPSADAIIAGTIRLEAFVNSASAATVEFLVDGDSVGEDDSYPYQVFWNSVEVPNGGHEIIAVATSKNLTAASAPVDITVENLGCIAVTAIGQTPTGGSINGPLPIFTFAISPPPTQSPTVFAGSVTLFEKLPPGAYTVSQSEESLPPGWVEEYMSPSGGHVEVQVGSTCATVIVVNSLAPAELLLEHVVSSPTAEPGDILTYTIVVTNISDVAAVDVDVAEMLPPSLTLEEASEGSVQSEKDISWNIPLLAEGSVAEFTVTARVSWEAPPDMQIQSLASVYTENPVPIFVFMPVTVTVGGVPPAVGCIEIRKAVQPGLDAPIGGGVHTPQLQFPFMVSGGDNGSTSAISVSTNALGVAMVQGLAAGQHTISEVQTNGWEMLTPSPQVVDVVAGAACAVVNFNNRPVAGEPTFAVVKTHVPANPAAGNDVTFSILVSNTSTVPTNSAVDVYDALPPTLVYSSAGGTSYGQGFLPLKSQVSVSEEDGIVHWEIPALPVGAFAQLTLTATVLPTSAATISNTAIAYYRKDVAGAATDVVTLTKPGSGLGCIHIIDHSDVFGIPMSIPWTFQLDGLQTTKTNAIGSAYFYDLVPDVHTLSEIFQPVSGLFEWKSGFLPSVVTVPGGPCVDVISVHYTVPKPIDPPDEPKTCGDGICSFWTGESCKNCQLDCESCWNSSSSTSTSTSSSSSHHSGSSSSSSSSHHSGSSSSSQHSVQSSSSSNSTADFPDLWCDHKLIFIEQCPLYVPSIHNLHFGTVMVQPPYIPAPGVNPYQIEEPLDCVETCDRIKVLGECCSPQKGCSNDVHIEECGINMFFPYAANIGCSAAFVQGLCGGAP